MESRPTDATEMLFSYGTLQQPEVQMATFGRLLSGHQDSLPGYRLSAVAIDDPAVVETSGKTHHPIVSHTGSPDDKVAGSVLAVTADELRDSDRYEVAAYRRQSVALASGAVAWAYVDARDTPT
ncbi:MULTISPECIES: gamma-glutamylcyclotransferase family protein [unclassified Duganella]|uniref:gamma-glutamylcyclotransferase family protein n=1 Tax=unclassified Duganella TaxID=2636909 RepID=UPI000E352D25|nr:MULTISPECIES: gamma-glutamylcyclotransferase family protein [unclassified Duganella]RFP18780.1 gamma-glutamylcyclotransferase [Duganella sp. BJB475]RFP35445.1 gamma-glutamylcyclotransferase [Duganella sp. BJB476]